MVELLPTRNSADHDLNDDAIEEQMPTHIIWGRVDSGSFSKEPHSSGTQTPTSQCSKSSQRKKITNMRFGPQILRDQHIELPDASGLSGQSSDFASAEGENEQGKESRQESEADHSGTQTSSDQSSKCSRRKKIVNKRLIPQRWQGPHIEFRDSSSEMPSSDVAGSAEGDNEHGKESVLGAKADHAGNQSSSDQGSSSSRRKIKNKRLIPQRLDSSGQSRQSVEFARPAVGDDEHGEKGLQEEMQQEQQQQQLQDQQDVSPEELDALLTQVPLNEDGEPTSIGSVGHPACKPCLFVHTDMKCERGVTCRFCHFEHRRRSRPRPCKGKRERYRKLLTKFAETGATLEPQAAGSSHGAAKNNTGVS